MKWKKHVLAMACMAIGFGLTGCFFSPVEDGIETIVDVLETRDEMKISNVISEDSKIRHGQDAILHDIVDINEKLLLKDAEISSLRLDKKASDKEHRLYHAKMTVHSAYGNYSDQIEIPLARTENNGVEHWLVNWNRSLAFPGLGDNDELCIKVIPAMRGKILDRDGNVLAKDVAPGVRRYPQGTLTSDAVGFVRKASTNDVSKLKKENKDTHVTVGMNLGRIGFEKAYQDKLAGTNGIKVYFKSKPEEILFSSEPQNGQDIKTTLDLKVQKAAYNQLAGEYGAASAINPQNGEVLALVSTPALVVENWSDTAVDEKTWESLENNYQTPFEGNFSQIFLPGSTQKLLTTLIGLRNKVITTSSNSGYNIYGKRWQPDSSWGGYTVHRVTPIDGFMTLKNALIHSDNIYFSHVALDTGIEKYKAGLKNLGISEEIPSDIKIYKSKISNSGEIEGPIALADTSYGQAQNLISPLQMNMYYASMLNHGNVYVPKTNMASESKVWKEAIASKEMINFLNLAFEQVVNVVHQNGRRGYARIAGKTGTAEVGPDGSINLGWFCGYDLNNPEFSMCIMVNHVEDRGGSDVNTGKFARVLDSLYQNGNKYQPSK